MFKRFFTGKKSEWIPNVVIIETEDGEFYWHIQGDISRMETDYRMIDVSDSERLKFKNYTVVTITIKPYSEEG